MSPEFEKAEAVGPIPHNVNSNDVMRVTLTDQRRSHEGEAVTSDSDHIGYGPLARVKSKDAPLSAFGGELQPGLYRSVKQRRFGNPAPLGLSAFALTTFVLSLINIGARDIASSNIIISLAFGYGGLVQLLAGMWEMAIGNTFGATALSSYGGFWISFAIVLTPGGFNIGESLTTAHGDETQFYNSLGLFLFGWFIFTFILLLCTLKSTVAIFILYLSLDITFLLLGIAYVHRGGDGKPNTPVMKAAGLFGLLAAFAAWYNALAGIADTSNSFFIIPVIHFPWSATSHQRRQKTEHEVA